MVVRKALSVVGVKIPLTSHGFTAVIHEDAMLRAHGTVEILKPIRLFASEKIRQFRTCRVKMLSIVRFRFSAFRNPLFGERTQHLIQPVFIRHLPRPRIGSGCIQYFTQVAGKRLRIGVIIQRDIVHTESRCTQIQRKKPHRPEKSYHFLHVMAHIIRFRTDFHEDENGGRFILEYKPRVL